MKLTSLFVVLSCFLFIGCSTYEYQENNVGDNVLIENVENNLSQDLETSDVLNIEGEVVSETEVQEEIVDKVKEIETLFFDSSLDFQYLLFNLDEVYNIEVNGKNYEIVIEEKNGEYVFLVEGIEIPFENLNFFLKLDDYEINVETFKEKETVQISFIKIIEEVVTENEVEIFIIEKDNSVVIEWDYQNLDQVKYFKVMHSKTNPDVKYPDQSAIEVLYKNDNQRFEHFYPNDGINYYRISVVLNDDSKIHSEVKKVNFKYEEKENHR